MGSRVALGARSEMMCVGNRLAALPWHCMADPSHLDRVWDIIERVALCMLTTRSEAGLRAPPVLAGVF
jgi:hypothetical protein